MACPVTKDNIQEALERQYTPQEFESTFGGVSMQEIVDRYFESYNTQSREVNIPQPSQVSREWINTFAEGIGLDINEVEQISINGEVIGANGAALPIQQTVLYATGNTEALTEEVMHVAVDMVSQKNPTLYQEMFKQVTSLPIYKEIFDLYKSNPFYQNNGRVDVNKIKKEVIGKQLTQTIINGMQSPKVTKWWDKVIKYLKGLFGNYGDGLQLYRDAVDYIMTEDLGTIRETLLKSESYLREQGFNDTQVERVIELANSNITNDELKTAISDIIPTYAYLQVNISNQTNAYNRIIADNSRIQGNTIDGKDIKNNLITKAEKFIKSKLGNISDKAKRIINEITNNPNSLSKAQTQDVLNRFIDGQGFLLPEQKRKAPSKFQNDPNYDSVETEVREYLESFPKGTRFITNNSVYNPKTDTVANPDIIAVDPEGKTSVILFQETNFKDGEFMDNVETQALKLQVDTVRDILRNQYGIINFGQLRIQPINKKIGEDTIIIETSSADYENTSPYYLTPIPSDLEKTGSVKLDGALAEIRKLFNQRYKELEEGDKIRLELLNLLKSARRIQVDKDIRSLVSQSENISDIIDETVEEYNNEIKSKNPSKTKINDFTKRMYILSSVANSLKDLQTSLGGFVEDEKDLDKVGKASQKATNSMDKLHRVQVEFTNSLIAQPNGVDDLTSPQVQVGFFTKALRDISQSNIAPVELLGRLVQNTNLRIQSLETESIRRLRTIKDSFDTWRKSKGLTLQNQLDLITQKDKSGRYVHKIIDRIDKSFYETITKARETGDLNLLDDIVDFPAYERDFQRLKQQRTQGITNSVNAKEYLTEQEKQEEINRRIEETIDIYDLSKGLNKANNRLKFFPKESSINYSQAYKDLLIPENKPALELYNYIQSLNKRAVDSGMMTEYEARTFLPIVRKSLADRMMAGNLKGIGKDFLSSITISEEDAEFIAKNDITGEEERRLPIRFMYDISRTMTDPNTGEEFKDTSEISTNIFPILQLWENEINKYDLYSNNVEYQMLNVSQIMQSIPGIQTTLFGEVSNTAGQVSNANNIEYLNKLIDLTVFGKRQSFDFKLGDPNKVTEKINKALGVDILPTTEKETNVSLAKVARQTKTYMILKTLGWKLPTAVAATIGSSVQGHIEAGNFYSKNTYAKYWLGMFSDKIGQKFGGGKDNKMLALVDAIMPLGRDEKNRELGRQLNQDNLNKFSFPRFLMTLTNHADRPQAYANAAAMLENTMVENGQLINIPQYVRNQSNWATLPTKEERDVAQEQIDKDIEELVKTRSLKEVAEWKDGYITIPGVEFTSEEFAKYRAKVLNIATNSTGMSDSVAGGDGNFIFQMVKTFKSWMYPLYYRRVGNLRKTPGTDSYDWGRYRIFLNFIHEALKSRGQFALDLMENNDRGINTLLESYQKQREAYFKRTGKELNEEFNESRFVELYQQGIKNALTEFTYMLSLAALVWGITKLAPDDKDNKEAKNFYNYILKTTDKGLDELMFFINPKEMVKLSEGGVMPPISVVKDMMKVGQHLKNEVIGQISGDTDQTEKALPTKYIIKSLPLGSNVLFPLIGFTNEDLAKELGYKETGLIEKLQ